MSNIYYHVEFVPADHSCNYILLGNYSVDPLDSWYIDKRTANVSSHWARLDSLVDETIECDLNKWLVEFVIPEMTRLKLTGQWEMVVHKVNPTARLDLRYTPIFCKSFQLEGEPFQGAIKQGYHNE